jgi:D-glycero-D-manno-heptose 1,7-bisphosphate phosphatase
MSGVTGAPSRRAVRAPQPRRRAVRRSPRRPAVFVDRDGTLNREVHYLATVEALRLLPGVPEAIRDLTAAGFAVVVVTNQSGVARGRMTREAVDVIHRELVRRLARRGAAVDAIYLCPHHPTEGAGPLRQRCGCRKPRPGLVRRAARELALDLARSYCVGDGAVDLGLAAAVGARGVLVLTGHGRATRRSLDARLPVAYVAANFRAAAKWIIDDAERSARHRRR